MDCGNLPGCLTPDVGSARDPAVGDPQRFIDPLPAFLLWGASLMPFYTLSEMLQLVVRYPYVGSDGDNGVRLPRSYNEVVSDRGDEYNELYAGLNVFFYGHKLKWQTGLQYADMSDSAGDGGETDGWCLTTGLRIYW